MPQIVRYIGGLSLYSWVFSSFLLAQGGSGSQEDIQHDSPGAPRPRWRRAGTRSGTAST
jgi:hypothetical protein